MGIGLFNMAFIEIRARRVPTRLTSNRFLGTDLILLVVYWRLSLGFKGILKPYSRMRIL